MNDLGLILAALKGTISFSAGSPSIDSIEIWSWLCGREKWIEVNWGI